MKRTNAAQAGIWIGGGWSVVALIASAIGLALDAADIYENWPFWGRILLSPWPGALVVLGSFVFYFIVRNHDEDFATGEAPGTQSPAVGVGAVPEHTMKGKFLHTITAKGRIDQQGRVVRDENGKYFVQFFSFGDGAPSNSRYLTTAEAQTARFYDSNDEMQAAYFRANPGLDRSLSDFANMKLEDDV